MNWSKSRVVTIDPGSTRALRQRNGVTGPNRARSADVTARLFARIRSGPAARLRCAPCYRPSQTTDALTAARGTGVVRAFGRVIFGQKRTCHLQDIRSRHLEV